MRIINFIVWLILFSLPMGVNAQGKEVVVKGVVVDGAVRPVEFATIIIKDKLTNTNVTGTTSGEDGAFELATVSDNFYVEVSFLGYEPVVLTNIKVVNGRVDMGTITLNESNNQVGEVVVRAEKSQTEFKLDKRVFNVGKDISSTGMSAMEVLNNVPSVNVDIEGAISLRGSGGVQILINGKPSVIASDESNALGTITAEMIERIEVITNPSAKYDAEGTSGIINIVIKKDERKGLNGSLSLNTGSPANHSVGVSLNRRTEKFNLFSQLGVGRREMPRDKKSINSDLINHSSIVTEGTEYRKETFYNVILGTDYHINDYNILTLSGNVAYEVEDQPSLIRYSQLVNGVEEARWFRDETTDATNPKWRYELQYVKNFKDDKEHQLLFSALGNFFGKDQSSVFTNTVNFGNVDGADQKTATDFQEAKYTFNLDYTNPLTEEIVIEAGGQYVLQDVNNDYEVSNWDNMQWLADDGLTNVFEYDQKVLGLYGTASYEGKKMGLKLGLRIEQTDLKTLLINTQESNDQNYYNFFPSIHTSLKLTSHFSLQAGYSKRIYRPRLWDLNPFFNIRNTYSVRAGNPDLQPEFTDSYELTSIYVLSKASLNFGVYYRYTTDAVENVSVYENNVNTSMPMNIGINHAGGIEFNGKYSPNNWLSFNGDFNYSYFNRKGEYDASSFDFNADQWSSKLVSKLKFPADVEVEITGNYRSKRKTVQWEYEDNLYASLGLRKKMMKGRVVVNLGVRDVFASRKSEYENHDSDYYLYGLTEGRRFFTFGISYGFGDGEAMEYSGRRRR